MLGYKNSWNHYLGVECATPEIIVKGFVDFKCITLFFATFYQID